MSTRPRERFVKTKGVTCFSEVNNDLLMWAHYSEGYRGFCLEFRTESEAFQKLRKVSYVDRIPEISIVPLVCDKDVNELFEKAYCTKSAAWAYEREWRAFHVVAGSLFGYPREALRAVYFGPNIDRQGLEIVCLILGGQNPDVEFWRGNKSDVEFKIEFEQFTYTPHIVGKMLGLL